MTKEQLRWLIQNRVVVMDGATGTNLQKKGMPTGVCPEQWILEHKEVMIDLQTSYINAGSDIIYAPTFSGNRIKLAEYGLEDKAREMNLSLVALSKEAVQRAGHRGYVAGNLTMTGQMLYPMGNLAFETLVDVYKEQVSYLVEAGVDLFVVETMMSLAESRAALIAIKETSDLPVIISLTYNEDGRTLFGTDPKTAVVTLQSLGADAIGVNCSTGPKEMTALVKEMKEYANIPILAKPNAGMPTVVDGETVYEMSPTEFAEAGRLLVEAGANMVGGCCGTTPEHISALSKAVRTMDLPEVSSKKRRLLSSERKTVEIDIDGPFMVVGERINPTGKKKLQAELKEGSLDMVLTMAEEQEANGAQILDINMGMNGIDEKEMMLKVIYEVSSQTNLPLCIDSSHVDIIEAALRVYPGRALINSISMESEKIEKLLPIARKYGAMFILLPLSDEGLPKDMEEKNQIIHEIYNRAMDLGFTKEDIIVDGLVATVGANKNAALETLATIRYCKNELELATICGLSNISFGLPERMNVNTAFLTMAIQNGLTMAIANPSQAMLMNAAFATDLLLNKEEADVRYIERMATHATSVVVNTPKPVVNEKSGDSTVVESQNVDSPIFTAVLKGNKNKITDLVIKAVEEEKKDPKEILDEILVPAINHVGKLFNEKIYFLPQLIASAEAMEEAIKYIEPKLSALSDGEKKATIVIATVEGDIHDIGKNLVALMLRNYGYQVIDLGKDVPKEDIIKAAIEHKASIIALSALMTTTMMRMKDVVAYAKEVNVPAKVIIGGAVITESFATEIHADGYSKDAAEAVLLVERLLK